MIALNTLYTELKKLHQQQARHKSHYSFIQLCLKYNVILTGLKIKKQPAVPETKLKRAFLKKWDNILLKTSRTLLKELKIYHREAVELLSGEIIDRRARLQNRQDFHHNIQKIDQYTTRTEERFEEIKKRKIKKLVGTRTENKRCRRKNKVKSRQRQMNINTNTVVNISNVPLSRAENDLLARGLSFCPRPSQIDHFQLKDDIQQFITRLRLRELFTIKRVKARKYTRLGKNQNGRLPAIEIQP